MRHLCVKHNPVALAALLALGASPAFAQPAPTQLPVLKPGGALINARVGGPSGNALNVTQTASSSNRALVEWSSFNIGSAARVNIVQPNTQSVLVNRVVGTGTSGPSASQIYGAMSANGRVFLVNPSGVVFGPGAQVNVGSLVATSLDLDERMTANNYQGLMNGGEVLLNQGAGAGAIQVQAAEDASRPQIQVTEGGSIVLMSPGQVTQGGSLHAPGGHIHLGSAAAATLQPVGTSGFVNVVTLLPGTGGVELGANSRTVASSGTGIAAGHISLQGPEIRVREGSEAAADGRMGGGRIDIGNEDTRAILVERGATLSADATEVGNGGSVLLRAMYNNADIGGSAPVAREDFGVAEMYGSIRARGGVAAGNGGQIETSGVAINTRLADANGTLTHRGVVDASARAAGGTAGTWTLDPYNVTISNATASVSNVNGSFIPSPAGTNVNAADLSAALNGGTSIEITTGTTQIGSDAGNITLLAGTTVSRTAGAGTATLTLRAHNDISLEGGSIIQGSTGNPLDVNLYSNLDGIGSGSVTLTGTLRTFGGHVDIGGGLAPATGHALSNGQIDGVHLSGAVIDTRGASGRGNVSMRGQAPSGSVARGVSVESSSITANNISISGLGGDNAAVALGGPFGSYSRFDATGLVAVRGFASSSVGTSARPVGVLLEGLHVVLGNTGSLHAAGRAVNASGTTFGVAGLLYRSTHIEAGASTTGTVTLAGELVGPGQAGLAFLDAQSLPLRINSDTPQPTGANVVFGGSASAGQAIDLGDMTEIVTAGTVNLRPLGVDAAGALVERPATDIRISNEATNGEFSLHPDWLVPAGVGFGGISAEGGTLLGSSLHTGRIVVEDSTLQRHAGVSLTLQNQGAGSAGIELGSDMALGNLGLRSSGNITQIAGSSTNGLAISGNLVVEGGPQSVVSIDSATNSIGALAFDPPASFTLQTTGALTIGAASTAGYTPGTGFTPLSITTSIGGDAALIQSTGAITINQPVTMAGASAQLDIVAPSITLAPGVAVTAPAGGSAQLWAGTFAGTPPGPNLYGCVYGDSTTCSVSGIALPATGTQVLHPTQPTLVVAANPATGYLDLALPTLTYTATGLLNGDTAAGALAGVLDAAPAGTGSYAIGQGSLTSPLGYNVTFTPSTLVLRPGITRHMLQSGFQAEMASDVYGNNLDQPYVCTAASVIRGGLADGAQTDPLTSEWGKVRNQPQLSGCLNVTDGGQCSAF